MKIILLQVSGSSPDRITKITTMNIPETEEEWKEQLKDAFYSGVRVGEMSEAGLEGKTDFNHWLAWSKLVKNKTNQ